MQFGTPSKLDHRSDDFIARSRRCALAHDPSPTTIEWDARQGMFCYATRWRGACALAGERLLVRGLALMSSSRTSGTIITACGRWPFSNMAYFSASARSTKRPPRRSTLILDDPVAVTVSADQEQRGFRRTRRGRFMLVHDTFLSNGSWVKSADDWEIVVVFRRHVVAPAKQLSLDPAPGPGCFNERVAQDREKIQRSRGGASQKEPAGVGDRYHGMLRHRAANVLIGAYEFESDPSPTS